MAKRQVIIRKEDNMNKKRNLLVRTILSLTVALILCLGTAMPVFAAEPPQVPDSMKGTESSPAKAGITKVMRMPVGTSVPNVTFEFDIVSDTPGAPVIDATKFNLQFKDTDVHCMIENNILKMHHATDDIFANAIFPHAGSYIYYVTERTTMAIDDTTPIYTTPNGVTYTDELIFSKAKYKLVVYVANKADGSGTYISGIGATKEEDHDGEPTENPGKLDVTPWPEDHTGAHKRSDMIFQNDYIRYPGNGGGGDPGTDTGTALKISKIVSGLYADKTKPFEFTVTVDKPGLVKEDPALCKVFLMGPVVDSEGVTTITNLTHADLIKTGSDGAVTIKTDLTHGPYVEFEAGSTIKALLTDGQWLAFVGISTGAKVLVTESAAAEYRPKYSVIFNGATAISSEASNYNMPWTTPNSGNYTGEKTNSILFTNTHQTVTQTGISVDNLPFVIMIVMGALALVVYVVLRSRRDAKSRV